MFQNWWQVSLKDFFHVCIIVNAHMWHCMIQRITMVLVIYLLHWFEFRARDWVCTWAHDYHPLEFHSLGLSKATWVITFGFVYHYTETCWPFMAICFSEFWISQTCLHNHHKSFVPVVGQILLFNMLLTSKSLLHMNKVRSVCFKFLKLVHGQMFQLFFFSSEVDN